MNTVLLSPSASIIFMAILAAALLAHLSQIAGPYRLVHLIYAVTVAGLLYLFGTRTLGWNFVPRWVLFTLYTGLLIAVATTAVVRKVSDGDAGFFWKAIVIQQWAMAYIYAPFNYWKPPISALLLVYFLLEMFSWLKGSEQAPLETSARYPPLIAPKRIRGPCEFALAGAAAAFAYVFAMGTSREPVALPLQQEAAMEQAPPSVTIPEERSPTGEPSPESDSHAARQPSTGPEPPLAAMPPIKKDSYTAVAGDTVKSIAKKLYGKPEKWRAIVKANPGLKPSSKLRAGQVIYLPELSNQNGDGAKPL